MQWTQAPRWPGYVRYEAENAHGYYLCQKKSGSGTWRLAFKPQAEDPFKIIFTAGTLKSCKDYAEGYEPK